ncbi:LysR family transcriptional regulator [Pontibacter sp. SGAir0037]|uniref:LysR family transcriptional regulator n=1 Tax=Pontibacter sp. SGAir0037 TaxID=2571030 RepID=UPI0010CD45E4|nr:LysR family transcriptional regulator [Pontibacter sp. SGAir0037]QCR23060.1 LysR family transcriptional regulator [Pontibacter sp. SGAir0037]
MFDFRLKVFYTVAQKLSFTKAAQALFVTQPAVTKHIRELEQQLGVALFKRNGNSIALTAAGQLLLQHAQKIQEAYTALENDLAQFSSNAGGSLRVGASTTLAQYVLPSILALFKTSQPTVNFSFVTGNSNQVEQLLMQGQLDMGIVEGNSHHPQVTYEPFARDEIVLVTKAGNQLSRYAEIKLEQLLTVPLVMREHGSGTRDVVVRSLAGAGIHAKDLKAEIFLDSSESIKQYLLHSQCAAFLSMHSVSKELKQRELTVIDVKGLDISRTFQFISLHGQNAPLVDLFKRFCLRHYNLG